MDPLTAVALMLQSFFEMVTEIVKGQPPEVKEKIWAMYAKDLETFRKFWKIGE
jgi:hypothetical protein